MGKGLPLICRPEVIASRLGLPYVSRGHKDWVLVPGKNDDAIGGNDYGSGRRKGVHWFTSRVNASAVPGDPQIAGVREGCGCDPCAQSQ